MALKHDFYNEIFINEQKWTELINLKLLNIIISYIHRFFKVVFSLTQNPVLDNRHKKR